MFDTTNPYEVFCRYYAAFFNFKGELQEVEIDETVFLEFAQFKKEAKKQQNFKERHTEYLQLSEEEIASRSAPVQKSVEEIICEREFTKEVEDAIDALPEIQRRRLLLYIKYDLTYEQIADLELCTKMAVKFTIDKAKKKIKEIF